VLLVPNSFLETFASAHYMRRAVRVKNEVRATIARVNSFLLKYTPVAVVREIAAEGA